MPPPVGSTWEMFLAEQVQHGPAEVDLRTLRPGDRLEVATKNTCYEFDWREDGSVLLQTSRKDRPWGPVTLAGCVFRRSGILASHVLFLGGKLEFLSLSSRVRHRTTMIISISLTRAEDRQVLGGPPRFDSAC